MPITTIQGTLVLCPFPFYWGNTEGGDPDPNTSPLHGGIQGWEGSVRAPPPARSRATNRPAAVRSPLSYARVRVLCLGLWVRVWVCV